MVLFKRVGQSTPQGVHPALISWNYYEWIKEESAPVDKQKFL